MRVSQPGLLHSSFPVGSVPLLCRNIANAEAQSDQTGMGLTAYDNGWEHKNDNGL